MSYEQGAPRLAVDAANDRVAKALGRVDATHTRAVDNPAEAHKAIDAMEELHSATEQWLSAMTAWVLAGANTTNKGGE